jgi:cyanophycinase
MMAEGYETGFGYLKHVAIDQHLLTRHREDDLTAVVRAHLELLGIGLDDKAAIVVRGDQFEVIGDGRVAINDGKDHDGKRYYFLTAGDRYDLKARTRLVGPVR